MNSITITVPWFPILVGLGIVIAFFVIRAGIKWFDRGVATRNRHSAEMVAATRKRIADAAKLQIMKNRSAFIHPWEVAFDECQKRKNAMARGWIQKWISEQKNLPPLSCEAAQILAEQLACDSWEEAVPILAPYFDVSSRDERGETASPEEWRRFYSTLDNLQAELPEVWYKFWKELEDYPARWRLFLEKISTAPGKTPHVATRTSLTPEQASLLAKKLGNASHGAELYASILTRYITMEGESCRHDDCTCFICRPKSRGSYSDSRSRSKGRPTAEDVIKNKAMGREYKNEEKVIKTIEKDIQESKIKHATYCF